MARTSPARTVVTMPYSMPGPLRTLSRAAVTLTRVEAVVVALWIVTDFVFLAALMMSAAEIWRTVAGAKKRAPFAWPGAVLAGAAAFLIARNAFDFQRWSDYLVPAINLTLCGAVAPVVLVIGKLRRKF